MIKDDMSIENVRDYITTTVLPEVYDYRDQEVNSNDLYARGRADGAADTALRILNWIDRDAFHEMKARRAQQLGIDHEGT
ncbi:hypothetical protein [Nocardia salmonicida]|uniref:hypothetical protein n=1 Tax=Nocardia salmonicida TaxID=53431 RepID=UPI0037901245